MTTKNAVSARLEMPLHRARQAFWGTLGVALGVLLAGAGVASAQTYNGRPVAGLEIEGTRSLTEETLRFYLGLEDGNAQTTASLNERIHLLWSRDLIEDIEVSTVEAADGSLTMRIRVSERPTLQSVEYQGLKRLERADITDRITRDQIRVREGDPLNRGELARLKAAIEEMYAEKGFRLAQANYVEEPQPTGDYRVLFTVDEGDKVRIADVDFEGNTVYGDGRLRFAMKQTKETGFVTRLLRRDVFEEATFEEDLDKVRDLYRKAGYKNVVIGEPQVDIRAERPEATTIEEQRRRMFITIPIEEGQRWKLGDITIEGNDRFSDELLLGRFEKPRGGWLRSTVIDEGVEAVGELYSNTGHLFAQVDHALRERDGEVADVVVRIDEGDQFRIGRIEFEGNVKTKDKVLRRELGIQEGFVLSTGALRRSLLRIRQLQFFNVDEEDPVEFDFNNEEKTANLKIKGQEGDRTELLFGGGFSELDGFFGQLQFRTRNFLGRGEVLGVSFQSGAQNTFFDLSYSVPWFLDRPQSVGVQAFRRQLDYDVADQEIFQETQGGTVTYGRRLGLFQSLTFSWSRFDVEDEFRRVDGTTGELIERIFDREVSSLRTSYAWDKVDNRLWPTQGWRFTTAMDYTGGFLGGTTDFVRPRVGFSLFQPVTRTGLRTVFSVNVEGGYIEPFGDEGLFPNDRFRLGGENSVRGFRPRSLTVRDEVTNERLVDENLFFLGGETFVQFNFQYIFLAGGPFRVLAFYDAGQVYGPDQDIDLDRLRTTTGLELQVNVPVLGAPLRFIWSSNLDELEGDDFESFQFSVGQSF